MTIDPQVKPAGLAAKIDRLWDVSAAKIRAIERRHGSSRETLVYTVNGRYTSRGWTEWTLGFRYGSALLQFDATGDERFLDLGRRRTLESMGPHLTDAGVHDHGFTIVSTYGNLLRLAREGRFEHGAWERRCYETALACSAAVQARRWTPLGEGEGFIHSFNGPQSLFVDTIRTLRSLALGHRLGHVLLEEGGRRVSLLDRLVMHARSTARFLVSDGRGRDIYAARGRVAHEAIFNVTDRSFRCLSTQQGYSPFSTWTRGLAWAMCGFAEQLEFMATVSEREAASAGGRRAAVAFMRRAASAACDYYIGHTPADGIPYWDTGAPGLHRLGDYLAKPADPFNPYEPVDSSAAAIAAQGLLRLGRYLRRDEPARARRYWQAGLTVMQTLLDEPYLAVDRRHEGLLLHSVYHRPNGWDAVLPGRTVPCGESSLWGDYHIREAALYLQRIVRREPYLEFLGARMKIIDLGATEGRRFPAGRRTKNVVGGQSPAQSAHFALGVVTLDPDGGQVPWHNQEQEEVYLVVEGSGEMCLGGERAVLGAGQAVAIPPGVFHQITNLGETPLTLIYCYGPAGEVAHWRQELDGTLPRAGADAPPLPAGARPQRA